MAYNGKNRKKIKVTGTVKKNIRYRKRENWELKTSILKDFFHAGVKPDIKFNTFFWIYFESI